jgi:cytochrome c556
VKKLTCAVLVLVVAAVALAAEPTVKEIMTKAHMGGDSLLGGIEKQLKSDSTDWAAINKSTDQLVDLGKVLAKASPPAGVPGTKEGWEKQTKIYQDQVASLDAAAEKKDKESTGAALTKIKTSCGGCHSMFKPKKP